MNYSETYSLWINVSDNCATTAALVRFLLVPKMSKSPFPEWIILNELYHIFQDVTDQEKVSGRVRQLWLRVLVRRPQLQVGADSWSRHPRGQRRNLHPRLWPGKLLSQLIVPKETLSKGRVQKAEFKRQRSKSIIIRYHRQFALWYTIGIEHFPNYSFKSIVGIEKWMLL